MKVTTDKPRVPCEGRVYRRGRVVEVSGLTEAMRAAGIREVSEAEARRIVEGEAQRKAMVHALLSGQMTEKPAPMDVIQQTAGAAPEIAAPDYSGLSGDELRGLLEKRGLPTWGSKARLIERLETGA